MEKLMLMTLLFLIPPVAFTEDSKTPSPTPSPAATATLYDRLGQKKGLSDMSKSFIETITHDSRLLKNPNLKKVADTLPKKKVQTRLTEKLCEVSGGPCKFKGAILENVPRETRIGPLEWIYIIQDVSSTLNQSGVSKKDQMEILSMVLKAREKGGVENPHSDAKTPKQKQNN